MVKIERSYPAPPSLAAEEERGGVDYRGEDVIRQLVSDFHGKCYLCEIDKLQSVQVEHLRPHHDKSDRARLLDWDNLFLCCGHCNSVKNQERYETNVVDCCRTDPEQILEQQLDKFGHVRVQPRIDTPEAIVTARLLTECFERRNTGIREIECQTRVDELKAELSVLYKQLGQLRRGTASKKERALRTLRGLLSRKHRFAGFLRTYVRSRLEDYPELEPLVSL